jgi:hypothetical protein
LEKRDADDLQQQQADAVKQHEANNDFRAQYRAKRAEYTARTGGGAAAGRGNKGKAKAQPSKKMPCSISHAQASQFVPPGSSIWRGLTKGIWCGHCPPHKRVQATWAEHGEEGAMREVLRMLWDQHLQKHGLTRADCPFEGMW